MSRRDIATRLAGYAIACASAAGLVVIIVLTKVMQ